MEEVIRIDAETITYLINEINKCITSVEIAYQAYCTMVSTFANGYKGKGEKNGYNFLSNMAQLINKLKEFYLLEIIYLMSAYKEFEGVDYEIANQIKMG